MRAVTGGLVSEDDFAAAVRWLEHERLVLSASDLRCPHQRQAMVVLDRLYEGLYLTPARRGHFLAVCRNGLSDPAAPLLGVHVLLQGLRLERPYPLGWSRDRHAGDGGRFWWRAASRLGPPSRGWRRHWC